MRKLIFISLCTLFAVAGFAQEMTGTWYGTLDAGAAKLPLVLHITKTDTGFSATMDSPAQGANGIPISAISIEKEKVKFTITSLTVEYEGELKDDSLVGTFKQGGMEFPLTFSKTKETAAEAAVSSTRPQDPPLPYQYLSEEVRFENKEAGITLAGTLTLPKEGAAFSAAVLITGSGPQNRNEEIAGHRPFLVLSDFLTRHGIAVLRYDDRGVAESGGNYMTAGLDDFASDALSAVNYLKTRKEIDPRKIGTIGHSEGGTVAFILAGEPKNGLAFIVSLAGMSIPGDSLLITQRYMLAKASGASDEQIAENEALIAKAMLAIKTHTPESLEQNIDSITNDILPDFAKGNEAMRLSFQQALRQMSTPAFQSLMNCNPAAALTQITCPVLALNGEKDLQVNAAQNLERIEALVKSPVATRQYPNLNHLFQHAETGLPSEYSRIEQTFSPEVMNDIATWINEVTQ